jgi:hypothetical protein
MKKIFFLVILSFIIYSCFFNVPVCFNDFSVSESKENKERAINNLEENEFNSGIKNNVVFFNLTFGMNLQEVEKKFANLEKENILEDISMQYGILGASYAMNYHEYSNFGRVYCFFNDNKLNELQIDTVNQNNSNLLDLFIKKYGYVDYLATIDGNTEYHWINGNRHITIFQLGSSNRLLIQYIDTSEKVKKRNENILDWLGVIYKA